ncbi:MAG TPA: hypothetical protein VJ302_12905, partial [Blastocatellia bacterium]|nr:hypothetical protein [Blastocatellia bacterium]
MTKSNDDDSTWNAFRRAARKPVRLSPGEMITRRHLDEDRPFPLVVQPRVDNLSLPDWALNNRSEIASDLGKYGAILFRGFNLKSVSEFD